MEVVRPIRARLDHLYNPFRYKGLCKYPHWKCLVFSALCNLGGRGVPPLLNSMFSMGSLALPTVGRRRQASAPTSMSCKSWALAPEEVVLFLRCLFMRLVPGMIARRRVSGAHTSRMTFNRPSMDSRLDASLSFAAFR